MAYFKQTVKFIFVYINSERADIGKECMILANLQTEYKEIYCVNELFCFLLDYYF